MSVALPSKLLYQSKVESAAARSFRSNIQPQNGTGTYYQGDTITINIPTRNNLVLVPSESYLKFTATITNSAAENDYIRLDSCGSHGFIQRIRCFSGSNLISDIDNYGMLAKILMDIQVPTDSTYGKYSVLAGTRHDMTTELPTFTLAADADAAAVRTAVIGLNAAQMSVYQTNNGAKLNTAAIAANGTVTGTYCISLISLVGSLCSEKYIPLYAMTSAPLRVEIQLVSNTLSAVCSEIALGTVPLQITNCEYVAQMIELSDAAIATIEAQRGGGPLQFAVTDFRNYASTSNGQVSTASSTSFAVPIPAKFSSLKSIFIATRVSAKTGAITYFPFSTNKFLISDYSFRVGSQVMPSKNPNSPVEMFAECMKAIGSLGDYNHQPSIDKLSYEQDFPTVNDDTATTTGTVSSGSFIIGLDLENYSGSDRTSIFAGWNSNTDDIYFNPTYAAQAGTGSASTTLRFDAFAMFDSVFVCANNTAYVEF
jgi:hypothetical protein